MITVTHDPRRTRVTTCIGCGERKPCNIIRMTGVGGCAMFGPQPLCDHCRMMVSAQLAVMPNAGCEHDTPAAMHCEACLAERPRDDYPRPMGAPSNR